MMNTNLLPHLSAVQPPSPRQNFPSNSQDYNITLWLSNVTKEQNFGQHFKLGLFCLRFFFLILVNWFQHCQNITKHANRLIPYLGISARLRARCFIGCIKNTTEHSVAVVSLQHMNNFTHPVWSSHILVKKNFPYHSIHDHFDHAFQVGLYK